MTRATPFTEVDRLFEQMRRTMSDGWARPDAGGFPASVGGRTTNVDVETAEDHYLVHADLPGFEADEIDLRYEDARLTLEASHEDEGDAGFRRRHVRDSLRIPGVVDVEGIEADYHNGVLEVRLPRETAGDDDGSHRIDVD